MASILKVDDLRGNTAAGNITITDGSVTMKLQEGVAKHWHTSDGTGTVAVNDSLNNSSMTDTATGRYTFTFTNNFSTLHFSPTSNCNSNSSSSWGDGGNATYNKSTSAYIIGSNNTSNTAVDSNFVQVGAWGDLA